MGAMGTRNVLSWVLAVALAAASPTAADEVAVGPENQATVILKDGGRLLGTIVSEDETAITLRTPSGLELRLVRDAIASVEHGKRANDGSAPLPTDPNDTRLMFAPSGRPLGKGDGYVSNHYVIFPGFGYGLTKNLAIGGGFSTIPGLGLDEQVFYVTAQAGFRKSQKVAFSLGGLYAAAPSWEDGDLAAAVAYGVTTLGRPDRSLTLGVALASVRDQEARFGPDWEYLGSTTTWRSEPIVMVGGSVRVARRLSLVSENWLFLDKPLSEQAFGLALRFFSDRISVDAGFVFVPEVIDEGLPIPWLSFSYHFGPSRSKESNRVSGASMGLDRMPRGRR
jgi:hypothetical protein